jgi:hypothetical protein
MTAKAKEVMSSCQESKIILNEYSQGAEQVHGALQKANLGKITAVSLSSWFYASFGGMGESWTWG